ncbi:hypothetical protein LRP30_09105 [Bradyrhizobium sp. C-145]|uniref:hypothetical protein n=1 Tax=Bradyrhizobium sp. C-145 TaxID=574727 RepID=UPI00201B5ED4|nr:hypothetical protein [Bradyrhizobium sp. C-145]UQR65381.1 hypothetical protein LRP30_09105 [Bradyrhizobium sp. C-145]
MLGLASVLWSVSVFPSFWLTAAARTVSEQVLKQVRFRPGALAEILNRMQAQPVRTPSPPELARAEALIQLQAGEDALERNGSTEADHRLETAERKIQLTLAVYPTDSFLWLMMYSIDTTRNGFRRECISYLHQSYMTGPLEGWVALRRNRLALSVFALLERKTQDSVIAEFAKMVDAEFIEIAMANLTGVGWEERVRLLSNLVSVDISRRETLARKLAQIGVKADVPGIRIDERFLR